MVFLEGLPKSLIGKVMRRQLMEADPIYQAYQPGEKHRTGGTAAFRAGLIAGKPKALNLHGEKTMNTKQAILAFSQSEKIKSGLIWISQLLEPCKGLTGPQRAGAEEMVRLLLNMVLQEVRLAHKVEADPLWEEVEKRIDQALVMIHSGVAPDAVTHLTQALSQVTGLGHRAMSSLKKQNML